MPKDDESIKDNESTASERLPKENFSIDEINNMLNEIDSVVSQHKAEQQGVDPKEMVKTIRGGKVVWITTKEMNKILHKRRHFINKQSKQRSLRGEDSINSEIYRRLETCRDIIQKMRKYSPEESPKLVELSRQLEQLNHLVNDHAKEVRLLESAIERKKQEDPILKEISNATTNMLEALERNDFSDVNLNQNYCEKHLEEYLFKQKRLDPYIKKAKEFRLKFLTAKQKLYVFEYNLISKGVKILSTGVNDIIYHNKEHNSSEVIQNLINELNTILKDSRPIYEVLNQFQPESLENNQNKFSEADYKYRKILFEKLSELIKHINQLTQQIGINFAKDPNNRMVYQNNKRTQKAKK